MSQVDYEKVGDEYFEARGLRRYAGVWSLSALGVGAVISGDFFGWNFGLPVGGFGGMLVATAIVIVMYLGLCFSIAEMTAALPHTGGAYSFARTALGPWGAYVTGLAENMEYVLTPAVIVVGIGSYLGAIFETPAGLEPVWWAGCYAVFVGLNVVGVEVTFRVTVAVTALALVILVIFWVGALPHFDIEHALDVPSDPGESRWLPHGARGAFAAIPFAVWFFLAIEQLPLAAEEAQQPQRDLPRGMMLSLLTLTVASVATLVLNAGIPPGAAAIGRSGEPLLDGFRSIFGATRSADLLSLVAVTGLVASFHSIIFAYGRQIYSLSRAGYFPRVLSLTHHKRKTPHVALISGAVIGFVAAVSIQRLGSSSLVGGMLLNMAVFGAVIAYAMQMLSFLVLRRRLPELPRPYRSPMGMAGASIALVLSLVCLLSLIMSSEYRLGVLGAAVWYALGIGYFVAYARHRLVYSPEEAFAEAQRLR